jgi:hypothetical protein
MLLRAKGGAGACGGTPWVRAQKVEPPRLSQTGSASPSPTAKPPAWAQ